MTGVRKSELWRRLAFIVTAERKCVNTLNARGLTQRTALCLHNPVTWTDTFTLRTYYLTALTKPTLLLHKSSWYYFTLYRKCH